MAQQSVAAITKQNAPQTLKDYLEVRRSHIAGVIPRHMTPERVIKVALLAVNRTPKLKDCTLDSIFMSVMQAAELGLEPGGSLGHAYLIPYGNQCTFQVGYKGLIDLARRTGEVEDIQANIVYRNDRTKIREGVGATVEHEIALEDRGEILGVYAIALLKNGRAHVEYMTVGEVNHVRDNFAKSKQAWEKSWTEFARKTVLRRCLKYVPLSPEKAGDLAKALDAEDDSPTIDVTAEPTKSAPTGRTAAILERVQAKALPVEPAHDATTGEVSEPERDPNTNEVIPPAEVHTSANGKVQIHDQQA